MSEEWRPVYGYERHYSPIGGAFGNPIGALRTKGLLDYPRQGMVKAAEWLFL